MTRSVATGMINDVASSSSWFDCIRDSKNILNIKIIWTLKNTISIQKPDLSRGSLWEVKWASGFS